MVEVVNHSLGSERRTFAILISSETKKQLVPVLKLESFTRRR